MKRAMLVLIIVLASIGALALGYWAGQRHAAPGSHHTVAATPGKAEGKVLYWYDPMVPGQHFDHPGLSPMGMQMVPKYAGEANADKDIVRIDPTTVQNLGVRTATVERRTLAAAIEVPATISWDLRQATAISARVDAVVQKLDIKAPYTHVDKGEPLVELLAPQWNSALAEYRVLQQAQSADARALRAAARARLHVLGLSDADLRAAGGGPNATITLHAPQAGVIATLDVREGQRVGAGQTLMTLNGLSSVWIEAALPQGVAGTVQSGTPVTVTVSAVPGRTFHGTVETLLPEVDNATRTQRARIVIDNPDGVLSPGMFATVRLAPATGKPQPVVPDDALIATGTDSRIIVAEGNGRFRAVPVRTGRSAGGYTEIVAGLHGGEKVVVSGQFLIDSEASLSGALERLDDTAKPAPAASAPMPGMKMGDRR
jgi:Cu(I)/Ag(I) efflux system membrane fusion protein